MLTDEARKEQDLQLRLRRKIRSLEERDLQLWSIVILITICLTAGLLGLLLPNVFWSLGVIKFEGRFLPQLFFALITLIVLFNIYVVQQRRELRNTREELVLQMVRNEAAERLSLVDPLTDTFNRRYMDQIIAKDLSRAERQGISLSFLMIDINDFKAVNTRYGHLTGDRILIEVSQVLKNTFRASDIIIRYGGDEFLVMLSNADISTSQRAIERLRQAVEEWNAGNSIEDYKMALSWGLAVYSKGNDLKDVLNAADRNMYEHKAAAAPAHSG